MIKMIENAVARDEIADRIIVAKNGKRRGHGAAFRADGRRASWLAAGERAVGIVGGRANMAIHMPAGSRDHSRFGERVCFYGPTGMLAHEEIVTAETMAWFEAAYARAA